MAVWIETLVSNFSIFNVLFLLLIITTITFLFTLLFYKFIEKGSTLINYLTRLIAMLIMVLNLNFIRKLLLLIVLPANYESSQILKSKSTHFNGIWVNYIFKPKVTLRQPYMVAIGTCAYHLYWNLIFNLTYDKVKYEIRGYWVQNFFKFRTFQFFLTNLLLSFPHLNRLAVSLIKLLFRVSGDSPEHFIWEIQTR